MRTEPRPDDNACKLPGLSGSGVPHTHGVLRGTQSTIVGTRPGALALSLRSCSGGSSQLFGRQNGVYGELTCGFGGGSSAPPMQLPRRAEPTTISQPVPVVRLYRWMVPDHGNIVLLRIREQPAITVLHDKLARVPGRVAKGITRTRLRGRCTPRTASQRAR